MTMREGESRRRDGEEAGRERPENTPGTPERSLTDAADRMAEGESRVLGEAATEAREAKREAAELLWAGAKSFADAAAEAPYREHVRRFLERFASLGDEAVPTDALRKAREAARRAAEGSGDARQD